jgi:hypothetical protein
VPIHGKGEVMQIWLKYSTPIRIGTEYQTYSSLRNALRDLYVAHEAWTSGTYGRGYIINEWIEKVV